MDEKELAKREMFDGNRKAIPERREISKESIFKTMPLDGTRIFTMD